MSFIFFASGGIKSSQNVFGGNQFKLPEQEGQLNTFFTLNYFAVKCGVLGGQLIIPVLKNDLNCFEKENCYPLAFGVPSIVMMTSLLLFVCGKSSYVHTPPPGNMFLKVCGCIMVKYIEIMSPLTILFNFPNRLRSKRDLLVRQQTPKVIGLITQKKSAVKSSLRKQKRFSIS